MSNEKHRNYFRTDLATECRAREGKPFEQQDGVSFTEEKLGEVTVSHLLISTDQASAAVGKPKGKYVTVGFIPPDVMTDRQISSLENIVCGLLREFIYRLCPHCRSVLVAGLGNMDITADSVGPRCVAGITVTRHIKQHDPSLFDKLCHLETSAIVPGVLGQTGFESANLILSAVKTANPDAVIVIDALAARSPDRLTCTVQICDSGISPGSGVKNRRKAINSAFLGVPVIALGVPTVVDSSTLVWDTLQRAGVTEIPNGIRAELDKSRDFFVSPKEIDARIKILCPTISRAIDQALSM